MKTPDFLKYLISLSHPTLTRPEFLTRLFEYKLRYPVYEHFVTLGKKVGLK